MKQLWNRYREIINYIIFGILTTVVNIVTYFVFRDIFHAHYLIANGIAWLLSVLFAYITNRIYVFSSDADNIFIEMTKFFGSRISTGIIDFLLMFLLVTLIRINDVWIKVFVNVVVIVLNYVFSKVFVFTTKR